MMNNVHVDWLNDQKIQTIMRRLAKKRLSNLKSGQQLLALLFFLPSYIVAVLFVKSLLFFSLNFSEYMFTRNCFFSLYYSLISRMQRHTVTSHCRLAADLVAARAFIFLLQICSIKVLFPFSVFSSHLHFVYSRRMELKVDAVWHLTKKTH